MAAQLAGQDVVLAAQKGVNLSAGWDRTQSASSASSHSASVGIEASVGLGGAGLSVTGSLGASHQQATSSSATAVDTTVSAANDVTITTPGALTLNGAEVSGRRVTASAGSLSISSPLNTADYRSTASSAGLSVSIPVPGLGVGALGGSASAGSQTITDHYASTGSMLSGLYAGAGGLDVTVAGNTTLTAGVLSSGAAANDNHFSTGSLTAGSEANVSQWSGSGVSLSGGAGAAGGKVSGLGTVAVGDVSHEASSLSQSAIGSNITVDAGSVSGSYSRDPGSANGHLANAFDPTALSNELQAQQLGGQLVGEVGGQVADKLAGGNPAFAEGGVGRVGLETAGNAIVAAVTGGNVGAAALGTAAGGLASAATRDWAQSVASGLTSDPAAQTAVANALSNGVASVVGAAGGLLGGAGKGNASVNALSGAAAASAVQQFNQDEDNAKTQKSDLPEGYTAYGPADHPDQINQIMGPNGVEYRITDRTDAQGNPVYVNDATKQAVTFAGGQMTPVPQGWTQQGSSMQDTVVNAAGASEGGPSAADRLAVNRAAGAAFEQAVGANLEQSGFDVGQQITVKTQSGVRTRLDFLTQDPLTGEIGCVECKASSTAPLTPKQTLAFPEIEQTGGTIVGAGKPGFPGGTQLPPTAVQIIRGPK